MKFLNIFKMNENIPGLGENDFITEKHTILQDYQLPENVLLFYSGETVKARKLLCQIAVIFIRFPFPIITPNLVNNSEYELMLTHMNQRRSLALKTAVTTSRTLVEI